MASILSDNKGLSIQFRENKRFYSASIKTSVKTSANSPLGIILAIPVGQVLVSPHPSGWAPDLLRASKAEKQHKYQFLTKDKSGKRRSVGRHSADIRRDLPHWAGMDSAGWTECPDFEVFKYREPGTIQISVLESTSSPHRMMANLNDHSIEGWKRRLEFYAYGKARPGTRIIWVVYRRDPERCLFLKVDTPLDGWRRKWMAGDANLSSGYQTSF